MISSALPDINHFSESIPVLSQNVVISGRSESRYLYPKHRTPYLFIANPLTEGNYRVNNNRIRMPQDKFLLLAPDQTLEIRHDQPKPLGLFLILFHDKFFESTCRYFLSSYSDLLDTPFDLKPKDVRLPNVSHHLTRAIASKLEELQYRGEPQQEELDEMLLSLVAELLKENNESNKRLRRLKVVKMSTEEELYSRLSIVVQIMNDNVTEKLSLDQIALETGMNKFHLLDNFKKLHGVTPHKYFRNLKLRKAKELIQKGHSVSEVCSLVGFESIGSFSNLFKSHFHIPPSEMGRLKSPNFR